MLNEVFGDHFARRRNYLTEMDARLKMLFAAAAIIIVVSSRNPYVPLIAFFLSLAFLLNIRIPARIILLRLAAPSGIAVMMLIVQILLYGAAEGSMRGFLIMTKILGAVSLVIFLSMTTPVNKLLNAAQWFKVPGTWIEIAMLSYRYSFVLLEDTVTIRNAQKARLGYSSLNRGLKSFGELAGSTVIRAYDRSIAVYESMVLRGYNGAQNAVREEKPNLAAGILEIEDLYFSYPDGKSVLSGIDLSIKKGEFLGVLGANGSGKTTLLKIINGLLKTKKGEIYLERNNIRVINRDTLFRKVCTMFQNPDDQLFASTVGEDIAYGPVNMGLTKDEVRRRIEYALDAVDMPEFADKPIHNLSFGEKKRICLAGVLAMGPEVMLLDEPTSCLDPMGVNTIMQLLRKLNKEKGITMVMATHSVDLVPLFIDRAVILNKGSIVLDGRPEEVFSQSEIIKDAKLRLPRIGQLFEALRKNDGFDFNGLPLTIGQAREEIKNISAK